MTSALLYHWLPCRDLCNMIEDYDLSMYVSSRLQKWHYSLQWPLGCERPDVIHYIFQRGGDALATHLETLFQYMSKLYDTDELWMDVLNPVGDIPQASITVYVGTFTMASFDLSLLVQVIRECTHTNFQLVVNLPRATHAYEILLLLAQNPLCQELTLTSKIHGDVDLSITLPTHVAE